MDVDAYIKYLRDNRYVVQRTADNYNYSTAKLAIKHIDTATLPTLWTNLLAELEKPRRYGYVYQALDLVLSMLRFNGIEYTRGAEFNSLNRKLKSMKRSKAGYTDSQIYKLICGSQTLGKGYGLFKLLVLLTYSGIRISSAASINFNSFKDVPGVPEVMTFRAESKGHVYDAIISHHAVDKIVEMDAFETGTITDHNANIYKTSFSNYARSQLAYVIKNKGLSGEVTEGTSILHSFRKAFASRLADSGIESDTLSLLLGHIPNTLAYKAYIVSAGKNPKNVLSRVANAYARSSFVTWNAWQEPKQ